MVRLGGGVEEGGWSRRGWGWRGGSPRYLPVLALPDQHAQQRGGERLRQRPDTELRVLVGALATALHVRVAVPARHQRLARLHDRHGNAGHVSALHHALDERTHALQLLSAQRAVGGRLRVTGDAGDGKESGGEEGDHHGRRRRRRRRHGRRCCPSVGCDVPFAARRPYRRLRRRNESGGGT